MPIIPNSQRTPDELRKITRAGGIKSGQARREKKIVKERYKIGLEILRKELLKNTKDELLKKILKNEDFIAFKKFEIATSKNVKKETQLKAIESIEERVYGKLSQNLNIDSKNITEIKFNKNDIKKIANDLRNEL
jgi:hypothetical protein